MKVAIIAGETTDITPLLTGCTWSGDRTQAARRLQFTYIQSDTDANIPVVEVECGYTVAGGDDDGNVVFVGNVYSVERDRANSSVKVLAMDHAWILNRSKANRKFTDALPEDIARDICNTLGVKAGKIATTGVPVSFIANARTGYQIISAAYTEAKKKNGTLYFLTMNKDELDVIEIGELSGVTLNSNANTTGSVYRESIEELINAVQIVDDTGNSVEIVSNADSIAKYSMVTEIYRTQKDKDARTEALAMMKEPEREGILTALGDYRARAGYSLIVKDSLFSGRFYIKNDSHTFRDGVHEMRLTVEFEALMNETELPTGS